ncbi:MAG: hypothetical protein ACOX6I_08475 [Syntrophomonadaceae bacterium]|jgi:PleD family two-component response regulator
MVIKVKDLLNKSKRGNLLDLREKLHIQKAENETMLLENKFEKHYRSMVDELTGLPNRNYFERRLSLSVNIIKKSKVHLS